MISVEKARALILKHAAVKTAIVSLEDALGCVLAEKIRTPVSLPLWDNSAMDGFALRSKDTGAASAAVPVSLKIKGSVRAGDTGKKKLEAGEACAIMTGACVPPGADTVLVKELAVVKDGRLILTAPVKTGMHIRRKGEDVRKGDAVLAKGTDVTPGVIAALASLGKARIRIFQRPLVSVLATGSELDAPGKKLARGRIYDSNSPMLRACLGEMGLQAASKTVRDDPRRMTAAVRAALKESSVLILAGGVSVGDFDFGKEVLEQCGVKPVFWRVNQKPGKPLYFGLAGSRLVFGLPGNPVSSYVCFYQYVYPALRKMLGHKELFLSAKETGISPANIKAGGKTLFTAARRAPGNTFEALSRQGSHMVTSLAGLEGWIVSAPPDGAGQSRARVDLLPWAGKGGTA